AETRRLDTATARAVSFVRAQRGEVYACVANEVLHFTPSATRRASERPAQIERTLPGTVTGLLLFPDGTGLLRVASGGAHILHPHHLRPLESIEAKPHQTLVGAALNHRFVALLFPHGRASADDPVRHEVRVLERRVRSRLSDL